MQPQTRRLCRVCGSRPVQPARAARRDYRCSHCWNQKPGVKVCRERYFKSPLGMRRHRDLQLAKVNPLRAFYRTIGLEHFNLLAGRSWRGEKVHR